MHLDNFQMYSALYPFQIPCNVALADTFDIIWGPVDISLTKGQVNNKEYANLFQLDCNKSP